MRTTTPIREGKIRYAAAAWLVGAPTIVIIIAAVWGGLLTW